MDRRQLLLGSSALAGAPVLSFLACDTALAQSATHRTFKVGAADVTVLSDGHLVVPTRFLATNAEPSERSAALARAGQSGETISPSTNVTLVRSGGEVVLIDTGAGANFMPTAGKIADSLKAAGIAPAAITKVVFTHGHPDHLWGTLDDFDETPLYPNASYVMAAAEWDFWMAADVVSRLPAERQNFAPGARRNLAKIAERMRRVKPGEDIAPGLRALDTSGHTAGHMSVEIGSGAEGLVVLGDALTHPVISFEHPDWRPVADHHDPAAAAAMRRRLLARLAADRTPVIGFHLPFPGYGRVEAAGSAWRYVPI